MIFNLSVETVYVVSKLGYFCLVCDKIKTKFFCSEQIHFIGYLL